MKKYLCLLLMLPSLAFAQTLPPMQASPNEQDKAATICINHRGVNSSRSSNGKPSHDVVYDAGWEHCAELLDLKIKSDKAKEMNNIDFTKNVLEQLKGK